MNNYNLATGSAVRDKVEYTLLEEIATDNYVISEVKPTFVSATGAVPEADSEEIHLIHDCSQPKSSPVNDYADIDDFKYETTDGAIKLLKPGYYMAKVDLWHAYRSVSIHPFNYAATGLKWNFNNSNKCTYLFDTKLSYGGRHTPGNFHGLTQAVKHFMAKRGYRTTVVYLDDFLIISASYAECLEIFNYLVELLKELGFKISWHNIVPPTQALIFLGIFISSVTQTLELHQDKLVALQDLLQAFLHQHRASKNQFQSLAGKLSWACRVVYGGRTFLRHILDAMNAMQSSSARYRLSPEFSADLTWWAEFLKLFNGKQLFLDSGPVVDVQTDAWFDGMGAFMQVIGLMFTLHQPYFIYQACI